MIQEKDRGAQLRRNPGNPAAKGFKEYETLRTGCRLEYINLEAHFVFCVGWLDLPQCDAGKLCPAATLSSGMGRRESRGGVQ